MRTPMLGRSGLRVSELCLGTMTFGVTSVILGARSLSQLDDTLAAAGTSVPAEVLARLDQASAIPPEYPNAFIDTIQRWLGNR
jgi:aryl-alcohol dehydrogenase-like predicted oxidoreductase